MLIVAALGRDRLSELTQCADETAMQYLVEVHDEPEMQIAIDAGASLIGINNRNLQTFEVSLDTTERLMRMVASEVTSRGARIVSESGISTRSDMERLGAIGVDAVLIGEALMRETDIAGKLRGLVR
jgi:indole-3-glycerol phosphate synthase